MRHHKKIWKFFLSWVADIPLFAVVLFLLVVFTAPLIPAWFAAQVNALPQITYHPDIPATTVATTTVPLSQASFTELFSGLGWSDPSGTNAYEDQTATAISLIPDFSLEQIANVQYSTSNIQLPDNLVGTVEKLGTGSYVARIPAYPGLNVTSSYPGVLSFGYDPKTKKVLVVYAAYMSRVFEIEPSGTVFDYSNRFGQRAFGGASEGDLAVHPVISMIDGAWWIGDGPGSTAPKLMKIIDSAVIDYTNAFPEENSLMVEAGPALHSLYVIGDAHDYLLSDHGFKPVTTRWTSTRLNTWNGNIINATINRADDSDGNNQLQQDIHLIHYFLSNDGGVDWTSAEPNQEVTFSQSGGDLRFKIELSPSANPYLTPWVDNMGVEYGMQR